MKKQNPKFSIRQSRNYFNEINRYRARISSVAYTSRRVMAPVCFRITDRKDRSALIAMLENIRHCVSIGKKVVIDFSKTKLMVSDGALLFYSEIMRIIDLFPSAKYKIRCTVPKENRVLETLAQIGLLEILNPTCKATPTRDDVVNWRAAHGCVTNGESYDTILGQYEGKITEALQDKLYNGITEAMTNSTQHAYIMGRGDSIRVADSYKPWWMFSQEKDNNLMVVFCDLGVGIPKTLPATRPALWGFLLASVAGAKTQLKDSKVIREAVEYGRSRTEEPNRGKGLHQMVDLVREYPGATCVINSNRGCYSLKDGKEYFFDYHDSIMGTLIYWQVPVVKVAL